MSNIGPWIDKEDKLQWEYKIHAGYRGARNVRNGVANRDKLIETGGYMFNKRGHEVITGFLDVGTLGGQATSKIMATKALDEQHTHICISALCRRGASVHWSNGYSNYQHHCYDPELSGIEGQQPKQKRGLKVHMCKKAQDGEALRGGGSLPGNMQHNQRQVVPTSALEGCSEEEREKSGNEGCM